MDEWGRRLGYRVDDVCPHSFTHVHKQLHDDHVVGELSPPQIRDATASLDHRLALLIRKVDDLPLLTGQHVLHLLKVRDLIDLDLTNHDGRRRLALEATSVLADDLGDSRAGCDHRRLFHGHRHDEVPPVHEEADAESERQRHDANAVLYHVVCQGRGQGALREDLSIELR